jgi:PKD repeat protein
MVERCPDLELEDLTLTGNRMDVGLFGDDPHEFPLEVSNVSLTFGHLRVMAGLNGVTVEEAMGSLYLIGCEDVLVKGSRFQNASHGLALIDCHGMELMGNSMENCSVGLLSIDSDGLLWSNDLLYNLDQVQGAGMIIGKDYPAGGNHWSDLEGTDEQSGPLQDLPGADGVVDVPYSFDGVYDRYPKAQRCSLVHDQPWANISMSAGAADRAEPIVLRSAGSSGSGIANWTWEMGDGTVAYGPEVSHTYASLGTVLIRLTVRDHRGLEDTCERTLDVLNLLPECLFSYGPSQPDPGEVVSFTDLSSDLDGHIVTWSWSFGDGGASNERSPHHAFAAIGDYMVSLTVVDQDGGSDTRVRKVPVGNQAPVANFSLAPSTVSTLQEVTFTSGSHDADGSIALTSWDFGDGASGQGVQVKHRYSSIGSFTVRMTVVDDDGASSSTTAVVSVVNSRPVATFSCPSEVLSLMEVQFQDRSFDPDGKIRSWSWDFGDGSTSSSPSPAHTYLRPGEYSVALTVTDNLMASTTTVRDLKVLNRLPELTMTTPPGEHRSLERLEFEAAASDEDGEVVRIEWTMGDGNVLVGSSIIHAYAAPGNYTVVLTCTDDAGGMAYIETLVLINNLQPLAAMRAEQSAEHPLELMFLSNSSDPDGRIAGINWSFGDGSFAEGDAVVHRYDHAGQYEVRLTVIDDAGGMAETSSLFTVRQVNVSLYGPHLVHDEVWGWRLIAGIVNDGAVPLNITIIVTAGGHDYVNEHTGEGGSLLDLGGIWLPDLDEGEVQVRLLVPEGWDADLSDNTWTGTASHDGPVPYWAIGAGALMVAAVAIVLVLRRKG